jgi:hypothetical protein
VGTGYSEHRSIEILLVAELGSFAGWQHPPGKVPLTCRVDSSLPHVVSSANRPAPAAAARRRQRSAGRLHRDDGGASFRGPDTHSSERRGGAHLHPGLRAGAAAPEFPRSRPLRGRVFPAQTATRRTSVRLVTRPRNRVRKGQQHKSRRSALCPLVRRKKQQIGRGRTSRSSQRRASTFSCSTSAKRAEIGTRT